MKLDTRDHCRFVNPGFQVRRFVRGDYEGDLSDGSEKSTIKGLRLDFHPARKPLMASLMVVLN